MSVSDRSPDAAKKELHEEHRKLGTLVERLVETSEPAVLVETLDELHPLLKSHFAHEENPGGLYDSIGAVNDRFMANVRALVDDHHRFLTTVRGLADEARAAVGRDGSLSLFGAAQKLAAELKDHERREHALADEASAAGR